MTHDGLTNPFTGKQMINEASEVSNELEITRVDMDRFAERSQRLAAEAMDAGRIADEIVAVTVKSRKGETTVEVDEGPRPETTLETLVEAEGGRRRGCDPHRRQRAGRQRRRRRDRRRLRGVGQERRQDAARQDPLLRHGRRRLRLPGSDPWPRRAAALEKIGKSPGDVDLWEINEAFASVAIGSMRILGIDEESVNVNGGAIAYGHPIGASGSRIVGSLVHELGRRGGGIGVAAICSGGGQGDAIVIEVCRGPRPVSRAAAFFDLDKTLMAGSSGMQFARVATPAGDRRPPSAGQLGRRAPALPAARNDRRAHRRGARRSPAS